VRRFDLDFLSARDLPAACSPRGEHSGRDDREGYSPRGEHFVEMTERGTHQEASTSVEMTGKGGGLPQSSGRENKEFLKRCGSSRAGAVRTSIV
jgi:hypothetical protein